MDTNSAASSGDRALARDAALLRIVRTRRWILAGAAGLTAGLAALASALLPGKSFGSSSRATTPTTSTASPRASSTTIPPLPAPATGAQLGLQGSGEVPQAAPAAAQPPPQPQPAPQAQPAPSSVVSGGS